jgi:hypothetical protein
MVRYLAFFLLSVLPLVSFAQNDNSDMPSETDTLNDQLISDIEYADLGFLWSGSRFQDTRLGFIGDNYQRLQIRFLSIIKNYDNPFEYFIYGKSNVKENICEFQGSLVITEVSRIGDDDHPDLLRGYASGDYVLFEDQTCFHSGVFRGSFVTTFYVDNEGTFHYDDLYAGAPAYANNEFTGDFEEYYSDSVLTANWGDHRIPDSAELDTGLDDFYPAYKYQPFGWKQYLEEQKTIKEGGQIRQWWH